jgi:2-dehydro-3-deoxygluconokinase
MRPGFYGACAEEDTMNEAGPIVCFGEMLLRLSAPGHSLLLQDARLDAHLGGAEANVAVALARIGVPSALVTALPDDALGDAALEVVRGAGVDVSRVRRAAGRLGVYYLTRGAGLRPDTILYDRHDSLFARTPPDAWDWPALLAGARWLHLSGVVPAMGPGAAQLSLGAIAAARSLGVRVSFDANYRASMWGRWCDDPAPILAEHVRGADLLFGNHRDIAQLLRRDDLGGETPEQRWMAAMCAFEHFPQLAAIASTAREVVDPQHHRLTARLDRWAEGFETEACVLTGIVDRIGAGDAFAAGVLAAIDASPDEAALLGLKLAALKHYTPGDQSRATRRDADAFDPAGGLDVRR